MNIRKWLGIAGIIIVLIGGGIAVAQLPNTLNVSSSASGTAPAIRAAGIDANIGINLVPKGSGAVTVNGVPIAVGGGTVTSLTINPGPLAVTGTTNLTGPLFVQPGTATALKLVGARIFHAITDQPTTGTLIETLYTFTLPANTLAVNAQSLRIKGVATTAANANNKTFLIDFGATTIGTSGANPFNNDLVTFLCDVFRTGAATQKASCMVEEADLAAYAANSGRGVFTTPAEVLSGPIVINIRATTPTAAADLTARYATVDWYPVGQ